MGANDSWAGLLALICCGYCAGVSQGAASERANSRSRSRGETVIVVDRRRGSYASYSDASTAHEHHQPEEETAAQPVAPMPLLSLEKDRV
jgi:hypothetical protein